MNANTEIAVIMGGPSCEHDISIQSGKMILSALAERHNNLKPIIITRDCKWQVEGNVVPLDRALTDVKVAVLATHGSWGEDGHLQAILEHFCIPYTGSRVAASAAAFDKSVSRDIFKFHDLEVPEAFTLDKNSFSPQERVKDILNLFPKGPWVIKPNKSGSSIGVSIAKKKEYIAQALQEAWNYDDTILIEEYISGHEVTCGILEDVNTRTPHVLPPTQIIPPANRDFFDFTAKYSGETKEITPAPLSKQLYFLAKEAALRAHKGIGARHFSRIDMILKDGVPYVLELNTLPGLTAESILPKQAKADGMNFVNLMENLIDLALAE